MQCEYKNNYYYAFARKISVKKKQNDAYESK